MSAPANAVPTLAGNQMRAVSPEETVWLSASAGTGKTQVLSSRVLRLLLRPGVRPSQILCLTFTRAGATEMAARINGTLAKWVRLNDVALTQELQAIGADYDPDARTRARKLFAAVLDCPGGGLRIDTIHAFAQWLLGTFPQEAGLQPGTRAMEDRDRQVLLRQVLADLLVHAGEGAGEGERGDPRLAGALSELSLRMGAEDVEAWLLRCAEAREAWFGPGSWQGPLRPHVLRLLGLPADAEEGMIAALCEDAAFDTAALRCCMDINRAWKAATGQKNADAVAAWLALSAQGRAERIDALASVFLTASGAPRATTSLDRIDGAYADHVRQVVDCIARVRDARCLLALADRLVPALWLGRAFAHAWDEAKAREGYIDFDDQIRVAAALLSQSDQADWIRYKLDRRFDHILVDEAQDTNAAQWRIIDALTGDFFAGLGQRDDALRTLFVVGDYKQAIFRFQGTSPENFRKASERVATQMRGAADSAARARGGHKARELLELGLDRSFRTAQPVLDFVDAALARIGHENLGLDRPADPHVGQARAGHVALWAPVSATDDTADDEEEEGRRSDWLSRPDRQMADRIARQVKAWLDNGFWLEKQGRAATAGDVMVLVRKRRELAGLIVARLHAAGVPVAGVDRLRLGAPLAVRDLMAALRFAAQPYDDLNLAALLVSPLIGWTQEQLLAHAYRDRGVTLWDHLRRASHADVAQAMDRLTAILALADYETPDALLHWILAGPWRGRRALVARLGREADDPIDELVNAARAYSGGSTPSLAGFIQWSDAGEGELKRESGESGGLVRVLTAHGSKGLQAPVVILADATGNPDAGRGGGMDLADPLAETRAIPLPALRKDERTGRIAEEHERSAREEVKEHWRLLYVAMTRAEEALFIGGPLGLRETEPSPNSWYARLREVFGAGGELADDLWGTRLEWGDSLHFSRAGAEEKADVPLAPLPEWLATPAPVEARPPRPLAPSALGEEQTPAPPWPPGGASGAALRGTLIHKLLERLPDVPPEGRTEVAEQWLARNAATQSAAFRDEIRENVLRILGDPRWRHVFAPDALAEVPVAALVGGQVVAGTIDRLLISERTVCIVDFKSARRVPSSAEAVPPGILRQMAAYALALERIYPEHEVKAALLYTSAPELIAVPPGMLERHKQDLLGGE